jgi:hypothetical protein
VEISTGGEKLSKTDIYTSFELVEFGLLSCVISVMPLI